MRVEGEQGRARGAGVLLSDRHVVTCAHLLGADGTATVRISSTVCKPEWTRTARIVPDTWVFKGTERGDVALLELDEPTPCGASATLWRAPLSSGHVRTSGFPRSDRQLAGVIVQAELVGVGGREGEWAALHPIQVGTPWIEPGFSGAGVVAQDGEFKDHVIGIVVRDFVGQDGKAHAAWMLPTETMLGHIRQLRPYIAGVPTSVLSVPDGGGSAPYDANDPSTLAMAQELAALLHGGWTGTVVLTGGGATGSSWLTRLLLTADPAARATTVQVPESPHGVALDFGSVDAAFDASGKSVDDVRTYLAERFGFRNSEVPLAVQLLRRKPPVRLVISSVDRCADPDALISSLLHDLARNARWRGIRLVLGFDGEPPSDLPYEASLGPVSSDISAESAGQASRGEAEAAIGELRAAETEAATRYPDWELRLHAPPLLPRRVAPQLAIRCAVAAEMSSGRGQRAEYAAIRDDAVAALEDVRRFRGAMERRIERWHDLGRTLELYRERAQRILSAEDAQLTQLYSRALGSLREVPIDLGLARAEVAQYVETVNRRIEGEPDGVGGRPK